MAKTLSEIQMDFSRTMSQANELDSLAGQLERIADNHMENTLQGIGKAWTGEVSNQYLQKGRSMSRKIKSNAVQLKKIAEAMRIAARAAYDAERRAYEIARQRKYGK